MRKLTAKQLERLRGIAVKALESAPPARINFGMAPEDLVVACDRALGWDEMAEEDDDERRALIETSQQHCAAFEAMLKANKIKPARRNRWR